VFLISSKVVIITATKGIFKDKIWNIHSIFVTCIVSKRIIIITSALQLFVERGLQATPMSQVAKAAGTGMGTIYNHFSSKEELVNAIYLFIKEKEAAYIFEEYNPEQSVRYRFEALYGRLMHYFIENSFEFQFMDRFSLSPIITEISSEKGKKYFELFFQLFKEGQQERIIKDMPIQQLAYFVMGATSSIMRLHLADNITIQEEDIQKHLILAWDAIKN